MRKSTCCGVNIKRYGGKRRQCAFCKRTWSIRPARRGPKPLRQRPQFSFRVLSEGRSLRAFAQNSNTSREKVRRRFHRSLETLFKRKRINIENNWPGNDLIVLADALHANCEGRHIVIPMIATRPETKSDFINLEVLDCFTGTETLENWSGAFRLLAEEKRTAIKAVVCDQHGSLMKLAEKENWLIQLCHFHLKARFYRFLGNRLKNISFMAERTLIWQAMGKIVSVTDDAEVIKLMAQLKQYSQISGLPSRLKSQTRSLATNPWLFRTYLDYPQLNLPQTTSAMESVAGIVREMLRRRRGFKTISSLRTWLLYLKMDHPRIKINK
ncbi:MAG: hypothetical protein Q8N98_03865 [bacterium]|nr:hypothetical protein [bacterium]